LYMGVSSMADAEEAAGSANPVRSRGERGRRFVGNRRLKTDPWHPPLATRRRVGGGGGLRKAIQSLRPSDFATAFGRAEGAARGVCYLGLRPRLVWCGPSALGLVFVRGFRESGEAGGEGRGIPHSSR
jgi:hypothetical protein